MAIASPAQTFTNLNSLAPGPTGEPNFVSIVQGIDGNLYGTTSAEGGYSGGEAFKMTPDGVLTTIYTFCGTPFCVSDGGPRTALVQTPNGNFYGTTSGGGAYSSGRIFRMTPSGSVTDFYSFCAQQNCSDGEAPLGGLVLSANGDFYGTTSAGGANSAGTVFKITPSGALTTLYNFCSQTNCADGVAPAGVLVQSNTGDFYGTTSGGSTPESNGTVFSMTASGTLTTLYNFCSQPSCADGSAPLAGLIQSSSLDFYGTTRYGGYEGNDVCSHLGGCGTLFRITPQGGLTTVFRFDSGDGAVPYDEVFQGSDGGIYGTTSMGGSYGAGTIFELSPENKMITLHDFQVTDGAGPLQGMIQDTNGEFYGTTSGGGTYGGGTIFSLSLGLEPFVETLPASAKVGATVVIKGTNLVGATAVSFNGKAATFTVVSVSEITTTVPTGATSGNVEVTAPGGVLASNVPFRVTPRILAIKPTSGTVGTSVTITGVSFTQTGSVTFGGVPATTFTVNSDTEVTAIVPKGAKTGDIGVHTEGGAGISAQPFTVTP